MKRFLLLLAGSLAAVPLAAQQCSHFYAGGGMGISSFQYRIPGADLHHGFGGYARAGYTHMFNRQWGLSTGAELAMHSARVNRPAFALSYDIDHPAYPPGSRFTITESGRGYEERQQAQFVNIPLMIQSRHPGVVSFYVSAGAKLSLPLQTSFTASMDELSVTGYSEYTHQTHANEPEYGFATYQGVSADGALDLQPGLLFALEVGLEGRISRLWKFYIGLYFDYGLTDFMPPAGNDAGRFYTPGAPPQITTPVMSTVKVVPMALGGTLRFSLNTLVLGTPQKRRTSRVVGDACDCVYEGSL